MADNVINVTDVLANPEMYNPITVNKIEHNYSQFTSTATSAGLLVPCPIMVPTNDFDSDNNRVYEQKVVNLRIPTDVLKEQLKLLLADTNVEWRE